MYTNKSINTGSFCKSNINLKSIKNYIGKYINQVIRTDV